MFAAQFNSTTGGIEHHLALKRDVPTLTLPSDRPAALVEVLHASINPQDFKVPELPLVGSWISPHPATPGTDYVGRIKQTSFPDFKEGDLVFGKLERPRQHGTLGQFVVVLAEDGIVKVPQHWAKRGPDLRLFACFGVAGLTALQSFRNVDAGSHIFINGGSGGTGSFCIQIARKVYAAERIVTTASTVNASLVERLGADECVDYRSCSVIDKLEEIVQKAERKFDLVIDNIGDNDLYWQSHRFLKQDGRFVRVGAPHVGLGFLIDLIKLHIGSKLPWSKNGQFISLFVDTKNEDLNTLSQWLIEDKVVPLIHTTYSLNESAEAFRELKKGRTTGKIVIDIMDD